MKTYLKADLAFTPVWLRIEKPVLLAVFVLATIGFMLVPKASFAMGIFYGILLMLSEVINEYAKYIGIGCPKANGLSLIRSSAKGPETVKNAVCGDLILTIAKAIVVVGIPTYIGERNSASVMAEPLEEPYLLIALANASLIFALIMINKLIARSISVTLQTYIIIEMLLLWALNAVYSVAFLLIVAPDVKDTVNTTIITGIILVFSVILGVIFSKLNIKKCVSGFSAGYKDLEVIND